MNEPSESENHTLTFPKKVKSTKPLVAALVMIAIGSLSFSAYTLQQKSFVENSLVNKQKEADGLREKNNRLENTLKQEESAKDESSKTDQELAREVAQDFVDAEVLDTKYVVASLRLVDNFATAGVEPESQKGRIVSGITLKKSNGNWVVIYNGQNGPDQDTISRFAIPNKVINP